MKSKTQVVVFERQLSAGFASAKVHAWTLERMVFIKDQMLRDTSEV